MRADPATPMARIALIGYGALGRYLLRQLTVLLPQVQFALVVRKLPVQAPANVALLTDAALLQAWQPTLLIECAGHGAVRDPMRQRRCARAWTSSSPPSGPWLMAPYTPNCETAPALAAAA